MAIDGISSTVVFPLFNFILRSVQTAYEVAAVPAEASDYLKTISQVLADIKVSKKLQREKANYLEHQEIARVSNVIKNTEEAMVGVEDLVERARVDMSCNFGAVGVRSRLMWVMKDSTKIGAAMTRLAIASQSLHREITMLQNIQAWQRQSEGRYDEAQKARPGAQEEWSQHPWQPAPPTYLQATIDALNERRIWNERKASLAKRKAGLNVSGPATSNPSSLRPVAIHDDADLLSPPIANVARYIRDNEAILASLPPSASLTPFAYRVPAPVVEGFIELEASIPTTRPAQENFQNQSVEQPATVEIRSVPRIQTLADYPTMSRSPSQPLTSLSLSLPNSSAETTARENDRKARRKRQSWLQTSSPYLMESTTLIPGQREPMKLRFEGPAQRTSMGKDNSPTDQDEHSPIDPSETQLKKAEALDVDEEAEPQLERMPTRRRPPRVQRDFNLNIEASHDAQNRRAASQRRPRQGTSRREWQVQQQIAQLSKVERSEY